MWWATFALAISFGKFTSGSGSTLLEYDGFVSRGSTIFNTSSSEMCVDRAGVYLVQYQWCGSTNATFSVVTPDRTLDDRASAEFTCRSGCAPAYLNRGDCVHVSASSESNSSYLSLVDWNFTRSAFYSKNDSNSTLTLNNDVYFPTYTDFYVRNQNTDPQNLMRYSDQFAAFDVVQGSFYFISSYVNPHISINFALPYPLYGFLQSTSPGATYVAGVQNSTSFSVSSLVVGGELPTIPSFVFGSVSGITSYPGHFDFVIGNVTSPCVLFNWNDSLTTDSIEPNLLSISYATSFLSEYFYLNETDSLLIKTSGYYLITALGNFRGQQNNVTSMYLEVGSNRYAFTSLTVGSVFSTSPRALASSEVLYLNSGDRLFWKGTARLDFTSLGRNSLSVILLETIAPTSTPSAAPTQSKKPSSSPSKTPSKSPSRTPSRSPSVPTKSPTTKSPTVKPTTATPTLSPTGPTRRPTFNAYDPAANTIALATVSATLSIAGVLLVGCYYLNRPR